MIYGKINIVKAKRRGGIYKIVNTSNGKIYIGSSMQLKRRISHHINSLRANRHINPHLQNSWNLYGEDSFDFRVMLFCHKNQLLYYEQKLIDKLNPEYNISNIAGRVEWTPERKVEVSRSMMGNTYAAGVKHTEEFKKRLSIRMMGNTYGKGARRSEKQKEKLSVQFSGKNNAMYGRTGINHPKYGHKCSEETLRKMRESWKKREPISDEVRRKMSESHKGLKPSEETKQKMSKAAKDRMSSKENRDKISESLKRYWANKKAGK